MCGKEGDLSDAPKDEEQESQELADMVEDAARAQDSATAQLMEEVSDDVNRAIGEEFHSSALDLAALARNVDPGQAVGDDDSIEMAELNRTQSANSARLEEQPSQRRQWNTQKFIALFGGIGGVAGALAALYTVIKEQTAGGDDSNVPLPEEVKARIKALARKWWLQSDQEYWKRMSDVVSDPKSTFTIQDQILFTSYTIDLSPPSSMIWASSKDQETLVNSLYDVYKHAGYETGPMYLKAPSLSYQGEIVNRAVAATLLRYALLKILTEDPP